MKLSQLMRGVKAAINDGDIEVAGITCDSRRVAAGWVFVCIEGVAADGHSFAAAAAENGAAVVLAQRDVGVGMQILTECTRKAWAIMSANWFGNPAEKLKLIGVTGTNGKTSVTYMLKAIMEACGHKTGLIGTNQNLIGDRALPAGHTTPDPYDLQSLFALMHAEGCDTAIMEVSSHALDQHRVEGCLFEAGVFTNLTQDHLDYHGTMENYMKAKRRLFSQSKIAVINADDEWAQPITEGITCPVVTYAVKRNEADYVAKNVRPRPAGMDFELVGTGEIARVRLAMPGMFSVYNAMATAACALALGVSFEQTIEALKSVDGVKGRAEVVPTGRDFTVIIDYAHTPDALEKICKTIKTGCGGRLITLFGCGGERDIGKRPIMGEIASRLSDFVIVTSDNPRSEEASAIISDILKGIPERKTPYTVIENREEAIRWGIANAKAGDTLLLAGKGHETYQVLNSGRIHLDEREIVAEALKELPN